jgi:hypothetical protein
MYLLVLRAFSVRKGASAEETNQTLDLISCHSVSCFPQASAVDRVTRQRGSLANSDADGLVIYRSYSIVLVVPMWQSICSIFDGVFVKPEDVFD